MNKLLIIWVISLILCPVFLLPVEVSAQIVVGPPGDLFGCGPGAAETIRAIEENCDVGGMGSHDDGDDQGLCTFVNIYKALCNDKTGPTGLIIRILKHYNQWKRFLALIGKAEKTAQELEELRQLLQLFGQDLNTPITSTSTDLITLLSKYNGQAGQLGGFCNSDQAIGTCLYTMKPYFNNAGNYQFPYDANNMPTQLIPRNGQNTYNFCKIPMCDPSTNVPCTNGCASNLECCAQSSGPDMNRYFQPTTETEAQMTLVAANYNGAPITVVTPPTNNGGSGTTTGAGMCQSTQDGFSCVCVLPGQACTDGTSDCHDANGLRRFRQNMAGASSVAAGCSEGYEQWFYSTGSNDDANACSSNFCLTDGSYSICEGDGKCCPSSSVNPGGNVPWNDDACSCKCTGADGNPVYLSKTVKAAHFSKCSIACANSVPPPVVDPNSGNPPTGCDTNRNDLIGGVCTPKIGCYNGNKACGACQRCDDDGQAGVCTNLCTDKQECKDNACKDKGGCPSIYTVNEGAYTWQSDAYPGIYSKHLEGTDYIELNQFSGIVVIKENMDELLKLNSIGLLEADEHSNLIIDGAGVVHIVENPEQVVCVDSSGKDCTGLVSKKDSGLSSYLSAIPEARIIAKESYGKGAWVSDISSVEESTMFDYIELTLPDAEEEKGKLILQMSGTSLLDFMEYDSLTKAGKNIDLVYDILESPIVGESIAQDIKLISGIRVKIEKDGEWVEYPEKISIVGGTYERTVIALDRAIAGSKVRLEFLRYAYAFDYIAYDDHQTTLETAAIVPVKVLFNSKDVSAEVAETDEDYVLVHKGEEVKAYYDIKPGKKYFLAVGGYYQPLKPSEPSVDYGDLWANKDYFIKITTNMDEVRRQLVEKFTE